MASVDSQSQGLEIGGLGQCRMDRVIGIGAGTVFRLRLPAPAIREARRARASVP